MHSLHLVSFDIPYPANYGGVIDVYYKLKALYESGVSVILHCFQYGDRHPQPDLESLAQHVYYYPRSTGWSSQCSLIPYIVKSRATVALLSNLLQDEQPILFEGLHCTAFLHYPQLVNRRKIIRMHNIEWQYYGALAKMEKSWLRKLFFEIEQWRLRRWEKTCLEKATLTDTKVLAISPNDQHYLEQQYPQLDVKLVLPFHAEKEVRSLVGQGEYILFHGKLSVADNARMAIRLIECLGPHLTVPFIVAGLEPGEALRRIAAKYPQVSLLANVPKAEMTDLIRHAHINLLFTGQPEGMKLKLLHSLFLGRFCLANAFMIRGTGLEALCEQAELDKELPQRVLDLLSRSFDEQSIQKRSVTLAQQFSNAKNAEQIVGLWD